MFAVINIENNIGQDICTNRALNGLPALMLQLPMIYKVKYFIECILVDRQTILNTYAFLMYFLQFNESKYRSGEIFSKKNSFHIRDLMAMLENALCSTESVSVIYHIELEESVLGTVLHNTSKQLFFYITRCFISMYSYVKYLSICFKKIRKRMDWMLTMIIMAMMLKISVIQVSLQIIQYQTLLYPSEYLNPVGIWF